VAKQYFEKRRHEGLAQSVEGSDREDISTRAMMEYFKPLMSWLRNKTKAARSAGNKL